MVLQQPEQELLVELKASWELLHHLHRHKNAWPLQKLTENQDHNDSTTPHHIQND